MRSRGRAGLRESRLPANGTCARRTGIESSGNRRKSTRGRVPARCRTDDAGQDAVYSSLMILAPGQALGKGFLESVFACPRQAVAGAACPSDASLGLPTCGVAALHHSHPLFLASLALGG